MTDDGTPADTIAARLAAVRESIATAASDAGRPPGSVTLVAVSKTHDTERIAAAYRAGQRVFGENRVQEASRKFAPLRSIHPDLSLHLIGPLQTNKVPEAVALFDVIETVDRPKLARALAKEAARSGRSPAFFVQINTGDEPQKAGIALGEADALIALARDELKLRIIGLMCIPPLDEEPALHFALLAKIAARNGLAGLSMGMSGDFATAIRCGATHVRVGTAIFGPRTATD